MSLSLKFFSRLVQAPLLIIFKIKALGSIFSLYKNWPIVICERIFSKKLSSNFIYELREGINIIVRSNQVDGRIVDNTSLGEYFSKGFQIKQNDTVIDIGAHIGSFALLAASRASKGKVFAYEPYSENYQILEANKTLNAFENLKVFKLAIFKKNGNISLFISPYADGLAGLYHKTSFKETVKCITLRKVFKSNKIAKCNFLKMDCEGAEYEILFSTPKSIFFRIDKIAVECHLGLIKKQKLIKFLEKRDFSLMKRKKHIEGSELEVLFFKK